MAVSATSAPADVAPSRENVWTRRAVNHMIAATGMRAGLGHVYPHMLRLPMPVLTARMPSTVTGPAVLW